MSDLIIAAYRSQNPAFVAGEALAALQQEAGTEPEDIVVVTRDGAGRLAVNHSTDLATGGALGGGRWGMLIGMMFLDTRKPQPGGAGLAARFLATGLDARFLADAAGALGKNGAAVGMRVRLLGAERVVERLKSLQGSPKIITTRLTAEAEENLTDMLDQIPGQAVAQVMGGGDI
jgi:uncharacterized membrane protein